MKCRICDNFFLEDSGFASLFSIPEICEECKHNYKPVIKYETLPISEGLIHYYYLYEELHLNIRSRQYLKRYWSKLFEFILEQGLDRYPVIFLDSYNIDSIAKDIPILRSFKQLVLVSLLRCNYERNLIFF